MNALAGNFTYPPPNSNLQFDYEDSVVTSWVTDDSYATECVLSLWYWLLNGQSNWTRSTSTYHPVFPQPTAGIHVRNQSNEASPCCTGVIEAVPANGSKSIALDVGPTSDFLAQFNINYNYSNNGIQQKYVSPLFSVIHQGEISPVTWNQQALSTTSVESLTSSILQTASTDSSMTTSATTSASISTAASKTPSTTPHLAAASTDGSTTTSATTSASTSTGASKTDPNPHSAAVVGLGVGIALSITAMGLMGFLYWKKMKTDRRRSLEISQEPATLVTEEKLIGELDARQRHPELSAGRLGVELDGSPSAPHGAVF